jgi:pimeloyl-ACP methyl ester carboxylesterase
MLNLMEILFVHGAFVRDGAWWWQPAADLIEQATGVSSRALALPSCGEASGGSAGLLEDAAALSDRLDAMDSVVVVAHSYGGTVVAQGARHPAVRHLVYISSFLPEIGQTHASLSPSTSEPLPTQLNPDGTVNVVDDDYGYFDSRFLHDVDDPAVRAQAHARLCPQSVSAFGTATTAAAWRHLDSTYLVCAADRSTAPELQRLHASRATHCEELPTSHHPFLSRPDLIAQVIARIVSRAN